jgi:hypothetical protein
VLAEPCPISAMPVLIVIVLSAWIVNHASELPGSGEFFVPATSGTSAAFAAFAPTPAPTKLSPTTIAPAPFTNFERVSVAPKMSIV